MLDTGRTDKSLSAIYEQIVQESLTALWKRRWVVITSTIAGIALGACALGALSKQYSASALVHAGYSAPEKTTSDDKQAAMVALDAGLLVETRSRLFTTQQMARRVVDRLGLERLHDEVAPGLLTRLSQRLFVGDEARTVGYQKDLAASKLLTRLTVKTEPRVYVITIGFTAGDPELAALITNAFVAEYLQITTLQTLSDQRSAAQEKLTIAAATFGEMHPSVVAARAKLSALETAINDQSMMSPGDLLIKTGGAITPAQAVYVPSSPDPKIVLTVGALFGLIAGLAFAMLLERGMLKRFTPFDRLFRSLWPLKLRNTQ